MQSEPSTPRQDKSSLGGESTERGSQGNPPKTAHSVSSIIARWCGGLVVFVLVFLTSTWAAAALYFDISHPILRAIFPITHLCAIAFIWINFRRSLGIALGLTAACFIAVLAWWLTIPPSNARDWQQDVAVPPTAEFNGNNVTIHNIRNCKYRSETDFDVAYYDRTFDLDALKTVDLYLVYWGSPSIAHTMVSFGFGGGQYVCISIETRKEKGESYSALRGFFRQYELFYVIADERDLVRLRTNFRKEDVYLYRVRTPPEGARALFVDYLRTANELHDSPKWYNALTDNCTTNIRVHGEKARGARAPFDWRIIVNGYSDQMLYERGRIDTSMPFAELKKNCYINPRAQNTSEENFSEEIRRGVPGVSP